jgi:hypothetical protein
MKLYLGIHVDDLQAQYLSPGRHNVIEQKHNTCINCLLSFPLLEQQMKCVDRVSICLGTLNFSRMRAGVRGPRSGALELTCLTFAVFHTAPVSIVKIFSLGR